MLVVMIARAWPASPPARRLGLGRLAQPPRRRQRIAGVISPACTARWVSSQAMMCISRVVTLSDSHEKATRLSASSESRSSRPISSK
jgi:hypothetical protein